MVRFILFVALIIGLDICFTDPDDPVDKIKDENILNDWEHI